MKIEVKNKQITVKSSSIKLTPAIKAHMLKLESRGYSIKFVVS